ncbi:unnamed protein product [Amoebophrya sp. A120]|nr:unnamed protein product [Amoebophrya sp. A120]|eukprot:GSA120T00020993001.1
MIFFSSSIFLWGKKLEANANAFNNAIVSKDSNEFTTLAILKNICYVKKTKKNSCFMKVAHLYLFFLSKTTSSFSLRKAAIPLPFQIQGRVPPCDWVEVSADPQSGVRSLLAEYTRSRS